MAATAVGIGTVDESDTSLFQQFLEWRQQQQNASSLSSGNNQIEMLPRASDEGTGGEGSIINHSSDVSLTPPSVVELDDAANMSTQQKKSFTAEQYLSTDKKFSEAKKIFRVCTRTRILQL